MNKLDKKIFKNSPVQKELSRFVNDCGKLPQVDCPLIHRFTPGIYIREIRLAAGTLIVSRVHRTEHPFVLSQGVVTVWTDENHSQMIRAPFCGITKAGTRRAVLVHEDAIWTTFHATEKTDVDEIENEITFDPPEVNPEVLKQFKKAQTGLLLKG